MLDLNARSEAAIESLGTETREDISHLFPACVRVRGWRGGGLHGMEAGVLGSSPTRVKSCPTAHLQGGRSLQPLPPQPRVPTPPLPTCLSASRHNRRQGDTKQVHTRTHTDRLRVTVFWNQTADLSFEAEDTDAVRRRT